MTASGPLDSEAGAGGRQRVRRVSMGEAAERTPQHSRPLATSTPSSENTRSRSEYCITPLLDERAQGLPPWTFSLESLNLHPLGILFACL
mmetsp:Transcript_26964/g.42123  ORF Transcript_26964/g.42123 Transcript_26964/m.42123 type:complete len:90 (-) Transcript_26964:1376-1645(-)